MRQRLLGGLGVVIVAALVAGGGWRLAATLGQPEAATAVFVVAALVIAAVVGVRSRDWTTTPYW
ncbi:hypothetical protein SAMN06269185_0487 [Natronoarchaeum philippinense]|uniref:Uncharacterized protein n=1 Tax=Natronoarchaeum philippinense TaxID=558529 RepID=A0A285N420_NATPI|nr:hypothetical protein [Natronoarchaeum philippinense]SNZ04215.1 hypothetical protein SAMN06269185_0487 [Natronoarchaeum philippinense]